MKRICGLFLTLALVLGLCACGQKAPTWEEQYDLGVKYLSEGNYQEAIIAFTAAIEIDPKRAEAYVGRGDAYIGSGETAENLAAALADYEQAAALDETNPAAYLGMADVYIRMGEYDKALEILRQGLDKTGNDESIAGKIAEMEAGTFADASGKTRKSCYYENGELVQYWLYEYDEAGNNVKTTSYMADGTWENTEESTFNEQGQEISSVTTSSTGCSSPSCRFPMSRMEKIISRYSRIARKKTITASHPFGQPPQKGAAHISLQRDAYSPQGCSGPVSSVSLNFVRLCAREEDCHV